MIKVKCVWLQRREPSNIVTKERRQLTLEEEYGQGMSFHKAEAITLENVTQCHFALISAAALSEPATIKQAFEGEYAEEWKVAVDEEYHALIENKTWELFDQPNERNILSNK